MGRPSLEGVDLKLRRAYEHLEALASPVMEFLRDPDSYEVLPDFDERGRPLLRCTYARQPPARWGVLIGEYVYNLHSALDQLAFQLAVANTQGRLPKDVAENSAFPIFNSGPKFRAKHGRGKRKGNPTPSSGLGKLEGVSTTATAIIERLQPYHRRKNPRAYVLWQLYQLSNVDKHRLLHVTHSSLQGSQFALTSKEPIRLRGYEFVPGPLKTGAVIARWNLTPMAGARLSVNVEADLVTDVAFGKSSAARSIRRAPVLLTLSNIAAFIGAEIMPPLCEELGLASDVRHVNWVDPLRPPVDWEPGPATHLGTFTARFGASTENDHA